MGTMEAVSRGAHEAGGHVVGVTCESIETWRPVKMNQWAKEERRNKTLIERLQGLINGCDAAGQEWAKPASGGVHALPVEDRAAVRVVHPPRGACGP